MGNTSMENRQSQFGKTVRVPTGYVAYVPHPLPPNLEWSNQLLSALSRADHTLGKLAREGSRLPNPLLLMRPFVAREAVLSSKIEGTKATIGEILAHEVGAKVDRSPEDLIEVRNYISALDEGIALLDTLPLSLRLIKAIHNTLMQGMRGSHAMPGEFRRTQNWIGSPGCTLNTAKYVPPPPGELMDCLSSLEKFFHNSGLPPLIQIALCHYQFEAIHPFLDGNGRVGRLLVILMLIAAKMLPSPLLYLSAFFEATRDEYYRLLYVVSSEGAWEEWLLYFLNGVTVQSEDVLSRAERINQLLANWQLKVAGGRSDLPARIVHHFALNPFLTVKKIAEEFEVAFTTAQRAIQKLVQASFVQQVSTGKREKVFCATDILDILDEPAKIYSN